MQKNIRLASILAAAAMMACGCGATGHGNAADSAQAAETAGVPAGVPAFSGDSAYANVAAQVAFGPRVPNTEAHRRAGDWLCGRLRGYGADVTEQKAELTAFDGTKLQARNIYARFNPQRRERVLLLAHWDCRPWADEDPDPEMRREPVDGANDGASGVGVLLEIARLLQAAPEADGLPGVDILLVDAEDWGSHDDDDSWALGCKYFVANPPGKDFSPSRAILLDMVGSPNATFYKEYFSEQAAPDINAALWSAAAARGYRAMFPPAVGSAVTDDHRPLIEAGIPAVDIIDYRPQQGFDPVWHTTADNMDNISARTLGAVGQTVTDYLWSLRRKQ